MTYKPDSDDLRGSPALEVIKLLDADGYNIAAYDKFVRGHGYDSIAGIAKGEDALVVLVEHTEIRNEMDSCESQIKASMRTPLILRVGADYKPDEYDRRQGTTPQEEST